MKIFRNLSRVLKISSAIAQGQKVSEYQIAWAYADLMLPELIEALKSGVSRSDAITALAVATQVKRSIACDVLCKKLKKAGYVADDDLEETNELDEQDITPSSPAAKKTKPQKQHSQVDPVIHITEKPKPVIEPKPVPVPPADVSSGDKEYIEKPAEPLTEPKPFRVGIRVGPAIFAGVDDIETEQQKAERRNNAQAKQQAIDAMDAKYGTAKEQADRVGEQ